MGDFDIASLKNRSSYAASMQKRKALGLNDSDSEDEAPKRKSNKSTPSPPKPSPIENEIPKKSVEVFEIDDHSDKLQNNISTTAEYIAAAEALMAQPINKAQPQKKNINNAYTSKEDISLIELSDVEEVVDEIAIPGAEIEDLDPELAALLNETTSSNSIQPLKVTVRLHYVHNFETVSDRAKEVLQGLVKPVKVILMDNEQFRKVLDSYCRKKNLKSSDVILTYNDDQIFLSGTPAGLGMTDIGIYNMHVYPTKCYSAMLEEKQQQKLRRLKRYISDQVEEDEEEIVPAVPLLEENDSEKIILKLRGKDKKDITLRVRPTATLSSLVNSYKQHAGVTGSVNLSFEGEILDLNQTIEQTDLEDEDLIEVV